MFIFLTFLIAKMWSHELRGSMIHRYEMTTLGGESQGAYKEARPSRSFHGDSGSCVTLIPWRQSGVSSACGGNSPVLLQT